MEGKYYIGSDLKFVVNITASGFDQARDKYNIDVYCGEKRLGFTQNDVVSDREGNYYLMVPTKSMRAGLLKMVITAFVPDRDFRDGYRTEIAVQNIGQLKGIF